MQESLNLQKKLTHKKNTFRSLAQTLKTAGNMGQGFVIENITGSFGLVDAERVARAAPQPI
jgi:tripartite-type tricarboxylate transporter receptor subunit TctC